MANFGQLVLTTVGINEQYKAQSGKALKFKRIALGSGNYSGNIMALTKLVAEKVSVDISKGYMQNNAFVVEGFFSNEGLQTGFAWREIGLFVEGENGNEVLYCYANSGEFYDYIPATTDERYTKYIRIATAIGNASNVTIVENTGLTYVDAYTFETTVMELQTDVSQLWPSKVVSGEIVAIDDSANLPLLGLNVYGRSTQDGTPTTDTPVDIVSVGESVVSVHGKNLLNLPQTIIKDKAVYNYDLFTGTAGSSQPVPSKFLDKLPILKAGIDYYFSYNIPEDVENKLIIVQPVLEDGKTSINNLLIQESGVVRVEKDTMITIRANSTDVYTIKDIQLEIGTQKTDYEPYTEQTIRIPYTLHGVPVPSGGNYTDADGQQWICDEVDLARGLYIQRIASETLTTASAFLDNSAVDGSGVFYAYFDGYSQSNGALGMLSDKMTFYGALASNADAMKALKHGCFAYLYNLSAVRRIYFAINGITTVEEATSWLEENKPIIHYPLATPIETALSESEIAAYQKLTANNPYTTVLNDAGAEMKVEYVTKTFEPALGNIVKRFDSKIHALEEVVEEELAQVVNSIPDAKLLWSNDSPSRDFAEQTIQAYNSLHTLFLVVFKLFKGDSYFRTCVVPKGLLTYFAETVIGGGHITKYSRGVTIADDAFAFTECSYGKTEFNSTINSGTANSNCIPTHIYAIH